MDDTTINQYLTAIKSDTCVGKSSHSVIVKNLNDEQLKNLVTGYKVNNVSEAVWMARAYELGELKRLRSKRHCYSNWVNDATLIHKFIQICTENPVLF